MWGFSWHPSRHPTARCHTASSHPQRSSSGAWGQRWSGAIWDAPQWALLALGPHFHGAPELLQQLASTLIWDTIQFAAMKKQTPLFTRKGDRFLVSIPRLQFLELKY